LLNELLLIKLLSELFAKHCNLPSRFWWFFSGNNFDIYLEMGISYKERSNRGGTPTGDQEIPAKAEKKVISLGPGYLNWLEAKPTLELSIISANHAQPGYTAADHSLYYLTKRAKSLAGNLAKRRKINAKFKPCLRAGVSQERLCSAASTFWKPHR
jgi:hypothetical protein